MLLLSVLFATRGLQNRKHFLCLFILARVCACFVVGFGVSVNKRGNRLLCFDLDSLFCTSANKRISFMT